MEAVGRLAGGIAHDFNNLLTVIIGMGQLSLASLEATRPERAEIEEMVKAGQRAADLTRQLLAFSRRQALQPRDLRVGEVLASMERLLKRMIGEDILLRTETAPDLGLVRADPGQLEQVIANLVVNARDAMPTGGTISMVADNVEVSEEEARLHPGAKSGRFVRLSVADTGTGMSDEVKSHIFEPFFTTKESGKGTGLGLATVFGIVQQSEGFIEVTSAPGHGSRFDIFLPRVEWQGSEVVGEVVTSHPGGGSGSVLVVDDHPQVLELSRRVLSAMGYTVATAESPEQALALASDAAGPFALLLTDVVMPGMNGVTLANRLREQRPELRVLLISGSTEETLGQHGVPGQSYPLLRKPFTPAELAGKVREVLGA
jgi:CheY-like chemotaxis protein